MLSGVMILMSALLGVLLAPSPTRIFILTGQSNMLGLASVASMPAQYRVVPPNVVVWDDTAWVPLKPFGNSDSTFGPEIAFGIAVAQSRPHEHIGLIKLARGGSPISAWAGGDSSLYSALLRRVQLALRSSPNARIEGVLWVQGERDARSQELALSYAEKLDSLVVAFRRDLRVGDLSFFCAEVNPPYPFATAVRAAQVSLPSRLPRTFVVTSEGLSKNADGVHYDAAGQIGLGLRFAAAYEGSLKTR